MTDTARTQAHRPMEIATPLGADKLLLLGMFGSESLGRLFQFDLDLLAESAPVDYTKILGQNVTVRLDMIDGSARYFNGYISKFTLAAVDESKKDHKKLYHYRATMVPWTWFLTRQADCRIFQSMTVPDIIEKIFRDRGFTDFKNQLSASYRTWEYCVQYRETDFNFISRLMENEGIYYYFEHENGKHSLVLCDAPTAHKAAPNYDDLHFDQPDLSSTHDAYIWDWTLGQEITPNQYAVSDFDPLQPRTELFKCINVEHTHDPDTFEIFDYPGGYVAPDDGRTYAKVRIEELEAQYATGRGTSCARGIYAGCTFTLKDHPACDPVEYLVTALSYQLRNDDFAGGRGRAGGGGAFSCQVTCIPKTYEFRPARITPKPVVQGPQTAIVVVPDGQEIYTDKYGRVKVKFHWDRTDTMNETASCWVRVSQPWAGKKWGFITLPRKGQEVIVDFLEGDPDRPIITGRVYNGDNMPPYDLPANATMTSFKSNSSKGGGGFNEMCFEDKKGEEQVFFHAEKNMDIRVKNDRFENIGNDRHLVVEKDKYEHIKNKRHEKVDVDHQEEIGGDRHLKITGKEAKEVADSKSLKVSGDVIEQFESNHSEVVSSDFYLKADNIVIEGMTSVTIKVGQNSIAIDSSGISISCQEAGATLDTSSMGDTSVQSQMNVSVSAQINLDLSANAQASLAAQGKLSLSAQGMAELTAQGMLSVQSSAILKIQGSLVMIN